MLCENQNTGGPAGQPAAARAPQGEATTMANTAANGEVRTYDMVVVGAGFGGLYQMQRALEEGLSVVGFEAGKDVGGTWYWNRYPGARCDIPSLLYSYTWSDELRDSWRWSEKYATQPEILDYARHVAERFDLKPHFQFETRVSSAVYDEDAAEWSIETDTGEQVRARFCVMATGCLSVPKAPDIEGAASFKGKTYVTGQWPHEKISFEGLRVAVIGTGSSAIQSLPLIAAEAKAVTVFQRTPNYSLPAFNREITTEERTAFEAFYPGYKQALQAGASPLPIPPIGYKPTEEELVASIQNMWNGDGLISLVQIPNLMRDAETNARAGDYVREQVKAIVKDPETADALTPRDFPIGAKRACVDTDYFETFNKAHVTLVDLRKTPIEAITPTGVRTTAKAFEADVIVYALGFDAMTGALNNIDIRGRDGRALKDAWSEGPKTYLGVAVAGFPNLFLVTGPGSPSVLTNMMTAIEQHVDWITDAVSYLGERQIGAIEAKPDAQEAWVAHVNAEADKTLFPQAASWYLGANVPGKPRVFMPYIGEGYKGRCDKVAAGYEGFALTRRGEAA